LNKGQLLRKVPVERGALNAGFAADVGHCRPSGTDCAVEGDSCLDYPTPSFGLGFRALAQLVFAFSRDSLFRHY